MRCFIIAAGQDIPIKWHQTVNSAQIMQTLWST